MKYKAYFCGEFDHEFTDSDVKEMQFMNNCLAYDCDTWDFEDENGNTVFPDCDDGYRSAYAGDYSPGNPWDAPGMSVSDFI